MLTLGYIHLCSNWKLFYEFHYCELEKKILGSR
jgi:hypothetical protein